MEHLDVLDAPWKEEDNQMIEDYRKARGCFVCGTIGIQLYSHLVDTLEETLPLGEYLCPDCTRAYLLGQRHGQR